MQLTLLQIWNQSQDVSLFSAQQVHLRALSSRPHPPFYLHSSPSPTCTNSPRPILLCSRFVPYTIHPPENKNVKCADIFGRGSQDRAKNSRFRSMSFSSMGVTMEVKQKEKKKLEVEQIMEMKTWKHRRGGDGFGLFDEGRRVETWKKEKKTHGMWQGVEVKEE